MTIEQTISKAIEGGWNGDRFTNRHGLKFAPLISDRNKLIDTSVQNVIDFIHQEHLEGEMFLDPSFWQSLGKAKGYVGDPVAYSAHYLNKANRIPYWQYLWCTFIEHLAVGKDAESFFANFN